MNAIYFATACILMVLVIYWGSAKTEPERLTQLFGQRANRDANALPPGGASKKKSSR